MSSPSNNVFGHVRTKLRQSRSSVALTTSTPSQFEYTDWGNVPMAFQPVQRAEVRVVHGYYLDRPLPGPPPRPRTASPAPAFEPRASMDMGNLRNPTPRTHRTRSAEIAQRHWSGFDDHETITQNKRASVNIAIALPPDHLDPPPPYSRFPSPSSTRSEYRSSPQPPRVHEQPFIKPYDPIDYVSQPSQITRRPPEDIPTIAAPEPPTPVSPLNALDLQYLAMRHPPAPDGNVTIEGLLGHPMLQHR
ncbi:uncharacterized protein Z519_09059 [Cladophialophora bantiana CBS 173.52]|uniref:Uncharacterized protein n=1 Tax=Cladophialophora bantiana (strain ATCC 10958 / CBS 173.52 / CDC B-1940 / NIH 8579) TaxID=1442370 RepID=A0A0D2I0N0_CLAB1|nr:uncharacterized protein Z519_09059 [Cladophialophora bantiana CBS 173.52]KIW90414.1 hypothetical protein Z519_09059 [Cladophialophora bantiana CBS 173.52]